MSEKYSHEDYNQSINQSQNPGYTYSAYSGQPLHGYVCHTIATRSIAIVTLILSTFENLFNIILFTKIAMGVCTRFPN